jgi:hypothetical protein
MLTIYLFRTFPCRAHVYIAVVSLHTPNHKYRTTLIRYFVIWLYQSDSEIYNFDKTLSKSEGLHSIRFIRAHFSEIPSHLDTIYFARAITFENEALFIQVSTSYLVSRDISQFPVYVARRRCFFPASEVKQMVHMKYDRCVVKHFRSSFIEGRSNSLRRTDFVDTDIHYVRVLNKMLRSKRARLNDK